jgi:hypothetical protein
MRKQLLTKMLLIAASLFMGTSAWAVTPTLPENYSVTGYNKKAYYNLASSNVGDMCPASGDCCYRASYGLFNFKSGNRSATITLSVSKGDLVIFEAHQSQTYDDAINSVSSCTKNATVSTGSYWAYDVTSDATSLTVNITRAEYICAILVMEKDESVKTGNYTINYKTGVTTVKTVSGTDVAVGTEIAILSSFTEAGIKYFTDGGQPSSLTVAEGDNNLDISVTVAAQYTCTVNAKSGEITLASPQNTVYSGDDVKVFYKKAYKNGGVWYMTPANGSYPSYAHNFSAVSANSSYDVTTYVANSDIVYFGEVEEMNLSGSFAAYGGQTDRYSNGVAGRLYSGGGATPSSGSWVYTDDITAGVYTVTMWARNQSGSQNGTLPVYLRDSEGNMIDISTSFDNWAPAEQGEKSVTVTVPDDGKTYSIAIYNYSGYNTNLEMDYLYVTKKYVSATITAAGWSTLYTPYALDFSGTGLTAYTATCAGSTVTLAKVDNVPANTGVVLKGAANDYNIPVIASSSTAKGDLKGSATDAKAYDTSFDYYYLVKSGDNAQFKKLAEGGSIAAGKAYLQLTPSSARELNVVFEDGTTAISTVQLSQDKQQNECFDLQGRRVAQPTKGLYIVNGKKVVIK